MAAENCNIQPGDTVAVWGCGPVGQFAIRSAYMLGASRVFAIDSVPERLKLAEAGKATAINMDQVDSVFDALKELTGGRGPDACIDAVGLEAHHHSPIQSQRCGGRLSYFQKEAGQLYQSDFEAKLSFSIQFLLS